MGKEKVTVNDLKVTLSELGVTSGLKQEKIIQRLQVNGCLIAMVTDVLDQLIKDEQSMFKLLNVQYKQEQKMHYNQMQDAAKKYYFHLKPFNKSFFGDENICDNETWINNIRKNPGRHLIKHHGEVYTNYGVSFSVDEDRVGDHTELFWKGIHTEEEIINLIKSNPFLSRQFNLKED